MFECLKRSSYRPQRVLAACLRQHHFLFCRSRHVHLLRDYALDRGLPWVDVPPYSINTWLRNVLPSGERIVVNSVDESTGLLAETQKPSLAFFYDAFHSTWRLNTRAPLELLVAQACSKGICCIFVCDQPTESLQQHAHLGPLYSAAMSKQSVLV